MSAPTIAVFGYGRVGRALTEACLDAGQRVIFAINPANPDGVATAVAQAPGLAGAAIASPGDALAEADLVILAVPYPAAGDLLGSIADDVAGSVIIDATNPVGPRFSHGVGSNSGAQLLAAAAPQARLVKCFNVYGAENLAKAPPAMDGHRPMMPLAGDDPAAKLLVADLVAALGWEPIDVGPLAAAVDLEHLALLWIRMVRAGGQDGQLVWSALRWSA